MQANKIGYSGALTQRISVPLLQFLFECIDFTFFGFQQNDGLAQKRNQWLFLFYFISQA
jgi:hypothetical protein